MEGDKQGLEEGKKSLESLRRPKTAALGDCMSGKRGREKAQRSASQRILLLYRETAATLSTAGLRLGTAIPRLHEYGMISGTYSNGHFVEKQPKLG